MTEIIQTAKMGGNNQKYEQKVAQEVIPLFELRCIGRGGHLPQGSLDFGKLWTDDTYTEK